MSGKTFYIESGNETVSSNDVAFLEYADYVAMSLKLQGAKKTSDKKRADLCIFFNYSTSDESYTKIIPFPVFGETGISSISTTSTTTDYSYGRYGNSTTNTTTRVNPSYGITGYRNFERRIYSYLHTLFIAAYDNKTTSSKQLWRTFLATFTTSSDFRAVVPYLAYAAWGKMGKSSGENEEYTTFLNDYYFKCWKQGTLLNSNVTGFPKCTSITDNENMNIAIVEKLSKETIVVVRKSNCISKYSISPLTYIECAGRKYMIQYADNYELGTEIRNECGTRYIRLHFRAIPSNAKTINVNIADKTTIRWAWNRVQIR
jgi:hypothetical protein